MAKDALDDFLSDDEPPETPAVLEDIDAPVQSREAFREQVQPILQRMAVAQLVAYHEAMSMPGPSISLEERRKALDMLLRYTGVEPEKKVDPNANLPVFNFSFNGGQMQATMVRAAEAIEDSSGLITDVAPRTVTPVVEPEDLLSTLDGMLGL